jgi:hypothetical protein
MFLADGSLAWWTTEGLVNERGESILDLASLGAPVGDMFEGSLSPDGERLVITWNTPGSPRDASWHWTLFERNAAGRFEVLETLMQPRGTAVSVPYFWLDADRLVIPENYGAVPAVVDFRTAEVSPIVGLGAPVGEGNLVIHIEVQ